MEQYPIPQFIEQEGKIAFFISFRQFFYLVGAGVICFILYFILPFFLFIILAFVIFGGAALLAFVTVNGVPVINTIFSSFGFLTGTKDYTWKKKGRGAGLKSANKPIKKNKNSSGTAYEINLKFTI